MQDINVNQWKLKTNDTFKEDEKITTNFEPSNDKNVVNKAYLVIIFIQIRGHILFMEKNLINLIFVNDKKKHTDDKFLIEKAVKATIQKPDDKRLFDNYDNADEVLSDFFIEDKERHKTNLEELNHDDNVIH